MAAPPRVPLSPRAQGWYDDYLTQLETIEERAPANIAKIKGKIGIYERIHGMSSAEMREKLDAGEIEETDDICTWLQLLTVLEMVHSDE